MANRSTWLIRSAKIKGKWRYCPVVTNGKSMLVCIDNIIFPWEYLGERHTPPWLAIRDELCDVFLETGRIVDVNTSTAGVSKYELETRSA